MAEKHRLDVTIHLRGLAESREKARGMIMAGEVMLDGHVVDKPGLRVTEDAHITLKTKSRYVSRGGEKLAGALTAFDFDPTGLVCADLGASTGGFTDCLLQHGAAKVYAIDVGYGQLDYRLRQHPSVVVMERTNARYLETLPDPIQLAVIDASFISLRLLLPVVYAWLHHQAHVIALVKPQFEAGKDDVGKGGVVRDRAIHRRVLREVLEFALQIRFSVLGITLSPIKGPAGNIEFLVLLSNDGLHPRRITSDAMRHLIETMTLANAESGIISDHADD